MIYLKGPSKCRKRYFRDLKIPKSCVKTVRSLRVLILIAPFITDFQGHIPLAAVRLDKVYLRLDWISASEPGSGPGLLVTHSPLIFLGTVIFLKLR